MNSNLIRDKITESKIVESDRDIRRYIKIELHKNGNLKLNINTGNIVNLYSLIKKLGFGRAKIDNRRVFFYRHNNQVRIVNIVVINYIVHTLIDFDFFKYPDLINKEEKENIERYLYKKQWVISGEFLDSYLKSDLTDKEIHNFKLRDYEHRNKFNETIMTEKLKEWGFKETIDTNTLTSDAGYPLYYKKLKKTEYLMFNHMLTANLYDCWIGYYENERDIGKKRPLNRPTKISHSYYHETDYDCIKEYIEK